MFSSSQKTRRKRGVILSSSGWQRLYSAQRAAEIEKNSALAYTLEDLNEITGLSAHTLTKVRRQNSPVDRQTLESYFSSFGLTLSEADYIKPLPQTELDDASNLQPTYKRVTNLSPPSELLLPEGLISLESQFYIERSPAEANCCKTVMQPGSLIRIKAARRRGKSSLMVRVLEYARQQGYQTVFLSLQMADRSILGDLDKFLQWFSSSVGLALDLPNRIEGYWDELFGSKISCKIYFEQYLLAKVNQPVVLALDDVDRLFDYPELADEFFSLLRTWHEQAKSAGVWQQLRLIVAHASEVYIPLNVNKSPFNVGVPIELKRFDSQQIEQLAQSYGLEWSPEQTQHLMAITCGQPYLVQRGLYSVVTEQISAAELLDLETAMTKVYADHLQRLLWALEKDSSLAAALKKVLQSATAIELELRQAFQLESLGLVELLGNQAASSCKLYTQYFRDRLL